MVPPLILIKPPSTIVSLRLLVNIPIDIPTKLFGLIFHQYLLNVHDIPIIPITGPAAWPPVGQGHSLTMIGAAGAMQSGLFMGPRTAPGNFNRERDDDSVDFEVADDKTHSSRNLVEIDSENSGMLGINEPMLRMNTFMAQPCQPNRTNEFK